MTQKRVAPFIGPLLVLVVLAFDLPLLLIFAYSVGSPAGLTLSHYEALVESSVFLKVLGSTVRITLATTATVAVLGYALAYWMTTLPAKIRGLVLTLVVLPFWVSVLVRTYAWIVVLGNNGIVNRMLDALGWITSPVPLLYNELGVVVGMSNVQMPFLVLPLYAAMLRVDPRHMQAAASLGASDRTIFWKVFFPQTIPALSAGVLLVMILCLGFYITPAILGGGRVPMVANMLDMYINQVPRWELASAASIVLLAVTLSLYVAYRRAESTAGKEA